MNLDLRIEQTEDGYFSRVLNTFEDGIGIPFTLPFTQHEITQFWQILDNLKQEGTQAEQAVQHDEQKVIHSLGHQLFQTIFPKKQETLLQNSLRMAYQNRERLHLRLQLKRVPEFAHLPWEYLYNPQVEDFFAQAPQTMLTRHVDFLHQIRVLPIEPPLRMLVVIASPSTYPGLDVEGEWISLVDTLDHLALDGKMILERLRDPTLYGLKQQLRSKEYHVLHFIGYGAYEELNQDSQVIFEDEMQRSRSISGSHFGTLLRDHYPLRLVVLSIREQEGVSSVEPFVAVANDIVQQGIPAAVAFRTEISLLTSITFIDEFYRTIADLQPVDIAITTARRAMRAEEESVAWGVPVYFTRVQDGRIFCKVGEDIDPLLQDLSRLTGRPEISESLRIRYML